MQFSKIFPCFIEEACFFLLVSFLFIAGFIHERLPHKFLDFRCNFIFAKHNESLNQTSKFDLKQQRHRNSTSTRKNLLQPLWVSLWNSQDMQASFQTNENHATYAFYFHNQTLNTNRNRQQSRKSSKKKKQAAKGSKPIKPVAKDSKFTSKKLYYS